MRQLYRFIEGFDVYFTSAAEGDARELISNGSILGEIHRTSNGINHLLRVNQVHSAIVRSAEEILACKPGTVLDGDAIVARASDVALGVLVADCAPVALASPEGVFACVHAGWRGIYQGVLEETISEMKNMGATGISAYIGPCIKAECYEFGGNELEVLAGKFGTEVIGRTSWGTKSLDIVASIERLLLSQGVSSVSSSQDCTACDDQYFSFRARSDGQRHLLTILPTKVMR